MAFSGQAVCTIGHYTDPFLAEKWRINRFIPNAPFLYPLTVFCWFQWLEKGCIRNKWINAKYLTRSSIRLSEGYYLKRSQKPLIKLLLHLERPIGGSSDTFVMESGCLNFKVFSEGIEFFLLQGWNLQWSYIRTYLMVGGSLINHGIVPIAIMNPLELNLILVKASFILHKLLMLLCNFIPVSVNRLPLI